MLTKALTVGDGGAASPAALCPVIHTVAVGRRRHYVLLPLRAPRVLPVRRQKLRGAVLQHLPSPDGGAASLQQQQQQRRAGHEEGGGHLHDVRRRLARGEWTARLGTRAHAEEGEKMQRVPPAVREALELFGQVRVEALN